VTFLDLTDAFGSISIEHILGILRIKGVDDLSWSLIINLCEDCSSVYRYNDYSTPNTPIRIGIRDGCPLSMLLFSINIDPILSTIQDNNTFEIETEVGKTACLVYAVDIALIAPD